LTNKALIANFKGIVLEGLTMAKSTRQRDERLQIMLDPKELQAVDNFRFNNRMPSRAAAVRELLKRGIAAEGFSAAAPGVKSSAFGVTNKTPMRRQ
jgi:hypothetical protein